MARFAGVLHPIARNMILAAALGVAALGLGAGLGEPRQGTARPQQQGQGQQGQGTQGPGSTVQGTSQNTTGHVTEDAVTRARQSLAQDPTQGDRNKPLTLDPLPKRTVAVGETSTFKVVARNPNLAPNVVLSYSLIGAPSGATIDAQTGVFTWVPIAPGLYTFYVGATDNSEPPRTVTSPVTIEVTNQLAPFGYSFFTGARALIDYRLAVVRNTLFPGPSGATANTQAAANLPIVTQPGQNGFGPAGTNVPTTNSGSGEARRGGNPTVTGANPTSGSAAANANASGQSTNQADANKNPTTDNRGGASTQPANQQPPAQGFAQRSSDTRYPSGVTPPPGSGANNDNSPSADALRYFVGPFDMLGLNVFVPAPERYQLGPGDILTIRYWSPALEESEVDVKVDPQGRISVPSSGRKLVVRGQTLAQAEILLRHELRLEIRNAQMSLSLKALRTMSITVLGDAYLPGNYQVPAVATLFNALYMFGGPSNTGSLRGIELRRSDGQVLTFDMYKFLVFGDSKQDVPLQPGDTIWIPPAGARVTVKGEVLRPGIYEAARGEHLRDVIAFAGGPRATGVVQRVSVETVEPSVGRQLRDVDLSANGTPESNPPVFDGDVATVESVRELYTNAITLEGAVDQPGQYAAVKGTTVADLIARARGLLPEAYTARADLFRRNPDKTETLVPIDLDRALARNPDANPVLRPFDRLVVYAVSDVQWMGNRLVTIRGAVQRPGNFYRADNMRVVDLILQAGGLAPDAYSNEMFLQRTEANGVLGPFMKLDFRRVAANDPSMNVLLQDKDVITIQTLSEAQFTPDARVRILGSVQSPGAYPRGSNMHLSDLIKLAGGLLPDANDRAEITNARVPIRTARTAVALNAALNGSDDPLLKDGDLVTVDGRTDIQLTPRTVVIMGAVKNPGPYSVNADTDKLSDLIARAGGFTSNAYPVGAQFFRDPKHLSTVSQDRFSPRIEQAFAQVNQESYLRALAKSQIDKARAFESVSSNGITIPGVTPAAPTSGAPLPPNIFDQQTVTPARPLTANDLEPGGNVNVDLPLALKNKRSSDNLVLLDGDIVVIPTRPTTVSVVGAVIVPSAVLFVPGKKIGYYVDHSGGFSSDAATDHVLLIRYRGQVVRPTKQTTVELGDIVWVPTKVIAEKLTDRQAEINTVSQNILSGVIVLAVLRGLFGL